MCAWVCDSKQEQSLAVKKTNNNSVKQQNNSSSSSRYRSNLLQERWAGLHRPSSRATISRPDHTAPATTKAQVTTTQQQQQQQ